MFLSYIFVRLLVNHAHTLDLLDIPNERSHHCSTVPRGGGIGFVMAFFIAILFFKFQIFLEFWYIFLSIFFVFGVGVVDDRYEVSARLKFIVIFVAVILLSANQFYISTLGNWFGFSLNLPVWLAVLFTLFAIAGATNALNLIDGLDGLSSSISLVIIISFYLLGLKHHDEFMQVLSAFSIASIIGFLILNWHPAKIFMGDSGSLTLGFIISILAVRSIDYIHPVAIVYLMAIPILDTLIVMVRRIRRGRSPFSPDKTHLHHILVKFFDMNVRKTVIFLTLLQIMFGGIGYTIMILIKLDSSNTFQFYSLIGLLVLFVLFYMIFTGIKKRQFALDKK